MKKSNVRHQWLTAAYTLAGLMFYWWPIVKDAHLYLFGVDNEGIKNYFTSLYYILYDKNQVFTGMNYPYGEHIVYTDAQPALSLILSPLMNGNTEYAGNIVTIINLLMIFSIPLGAVFMFRLFSMWKMPNFYSSVVAACIALLSPQVMRMTDHYSLSYVCFFPMIWYYAACWLQEKRFSSIIYLSVTLTFFAFIQAYYLAIGLAFISLTVFFYIIYKARIRQSWSKALILLVVSFVPLIIYSVWLDASGAKELADRPVGYFNFFNHTASLRDIFIPSDGIFKDVVHLFIPVKEYNIEACSYVGLAAMISTFAGVWVLRDRILEKEFLASSLGVFLMASIVCLLIAFCIPFRYMPESWIPKEVLQFRTLGRFAWPFYYVFAATGAWLLYILAEYLRKKSHSVIATVILAGMIILWAFEGLAIQKRQAGYIKENGMLVDDYLSFENSYRKAITQIGLDPEYYQAILAFPYFNAGSEEFYIERGGKTLYYATKAALDMKIPIAQNYLSRTSLSQTERSIQLLSHPFIEKELLKDIRDDRSFLLITVGNSFAEDEKRLIEQSRFLLKEGEVALYDLPLSAFAQKIPNLDSLKKVNKIRLSDGIQTSSSRYNNFVWKNFNGTHLTSSVNLLSNYIIPRQTGDQSIEVSLWLNAFLDYVGFPVLYADVLNNRKEIIRRYHCNPQESTDIKGNQVRASIIIPPSEQNHTIRVTIKGAEQSLNSFMIKPLHQMIWLKDGAGNEYLNNYPLGDFQAQ